MTPTHFLSSHVGSGSDAHCLSGSAFTDATTSAGVTAENSRNTQPTGAGTVVATHGISHTICWSIKCDRPICVSFDFRFWLNLETQLQATVSLSNTDIYKRIGWGWAGVGASSKFSPQIRTIYTSRAADLWGVRIPTWPTPLVCITPFCLSVIIINNKYLSSCKYRRQLLLEACALQRFRSAVPMSERTNPKSELTQCVGVGPMII